MEKEGVFYYSFAYDVDICRGEIIEARGGKVQCLGPQGQSLPVVKKRVMGKAATDGKLIAILSAAGPPDVAQNDDLAAIFSSFTVYE